MLHTETVWSRSCDFRVNLLYGRVSVILLHQFSAIIQLTHPSGQAEQFAANPNENSVGEASPQRFSVPLPGQKKPVVHPRQRGLEVEFKATIDKGDLRHHSTRCRETKNQIIQFWTTTAEKKLAQTSLRINLFKRGKNLAKRDKISNLASNWINNKKCYETSRPNTAHGFVKLKRKMKS